MTDITFVLEKQLPAPFVNTWEATGYFKTVGDAARAFRNGHGHRRMRAWIEEGNTCITEVLKQV